MNIDLRGNTYLKHHDEIPNRSGGEERVITIILYLLVKLYTIIYRSLRVHETGLVSVWDSLRSTLARHE